MQERFSGIYTLKASVFDHLNQDSYLTTFLKDISALYYSGKYTSSYNKRIILIQSWKELVEMTSCQFQHSLSKLTWCYMQLPHFDFHLGQVGYPVLQQ